MLLSLSSSQGQTVVNQGNFVVFVNHTTKMDDCTLKKLAIKPGALSPPFHTDILEYNSVVSSEYPSVQFECVTNDTSASYYVKVSLLVGC